MVIVILPAYNEERSIGVLLTRVREAMRSSGFECRVIVVNDGSSDGTAAVVDELAREICIERIDHATNRGLGDAVRTGLVRALEIAENDDIIITMDSDNTHAPDLIFSMIEGIRAGYDVIIASRYRRGALCTAVPVYRRLLSRTGSWIFRVVFPTRNVRDFTSGYRAYRSSVIKSAFDAYGEEFVTESGFACTVDILLKLRELGATMNEVPLILRYDFKYGISKMLVFQTIRDTFQLIVSRKFGASE